MWDVNSAVKFQVTVALCKQIKSAQFHCYIITNRNEIPDSPALRDDLKFH